MAVFRAEVDEEQDTRRRQTLDEDVEERLGLAVDPVQVLEDQEEGLDTRFMQQQLPKRIKRAAPPLSRIERIPRSVIHGQVEQRQQRRQRWLQSAVKREQLARHLLPD